MSEEEKKAIEDLKKLRKGIEILNLFVKEKDEVDIKAIDTILKLIDKQQKEIEEKSTIIMAGAEKVKQLGEEIEELKLITRQYNSYCINTDNDEPRIILAHKHYFDSGVFVSNFISKDKIRKKIEDLESLSKNITMQPSIYNYEIDLLKELLEESEK